MGETFTPKGLALGIILPLAAIVGQSADSQSEKREKIGTVTVASASGSSLEGSLDFYRTSDALLVEGKLSGVLPPGKHGLHIHEHGDCSAKDASSAGGHFNPTDQEHGPPNTSKGHVGDLGNIFASTDGEANVRKLLKSPYYAEERMGGWKAIIGKAVIVHAGEDDLMSQPSGDAGKRIGCGVIEEIGKKKTAE